MRRMLVVAVAASLLAACGGDAAGSEAFCDATRAVIDAGETDAVPPEVDTMVEEAPDEIKDAAETARDAFQDAFENQDLSGLESQDFQDAARELREYALDNCDNVEDITGE